MKYKYDKHDERKHARRATEQAHITCKNCGQTKPPCSFLTDGSNYSEVCRVCHLCNGLEAQSEWTTNAVYLERGLTINGRIAKHKKLGYKFKLKKRR